MVGTCNWCAHAIVGTCNCRRVHWCALVIRLVRLRRTRAILTVLTVPYLNTPYRTELLRWSRLVRSQIVQGSIVWRQHMRGACRRWKWEVLGRRGHSEAVFALAVPAWHHTVHRTVFYRLDDKLRSPKFENTPTLQKDSPYHTHSTVPSDRLSTSLIISLTVGLWV